MTFPKFDSVYILFIIYSKLNWLVLVVGKLGFVVKGTHFYLVVQRRSKDQLSINQLIIRDQKNLIVIK